MIHTTLRNFKTDEKIDLSQGRMVPGSIFRRRREEVKLPKHKIIASINA